MKRFIKIKNSRWLDISKKKMIHEDEKGNLFVGPPISTDVDSTVIIEASDKPMSDGYYHIIKVIKKT